jgi:chitinase
MTYTGKHNFLVEYRMIANAESVWDRDNPIGNKILGHTNLTEIDLALDLFWRNDVSPSKIVLGTGFYGRSFRLENPQCWEPGCDFSGPGEKGECTNTEGFLSYKEVKDILAATKAKPKLDKVAGIQYMTYGQNSWISYDDPKTIEMKIDFANKRGLKGLMTWAIDIDDEKGELIRALTGKELADDTDLLQFMTDDGPSIAHGTADGTQCYVSDCGTSERNATCKSGYTMVGRANTDSNGKNRCNTKDPHQARNICCPSFSGPQENDCKWHDERSSAARTDCSAKCDVGEINVINDSFGWEGDLLSGHYGDQCSRGWKSFCCKAGNMKRYLDICTWTECDKPCPSDKPHQLTTDTGGPKDNSRCGWKGSGDPFSGEGTGFRRLCCPKENSFGNCNWESGKVCSSTCALGKITLDLDPRGEDPRSSSCHNGRQQAFCCEPPGGFARPFAPFNLENLFPEDQLPPADAIPSYDLVSFGGLSGLGESDPDKSGVAFFLIAGDSSAVASMTKRDVPGLEFLDCPHDILERPDHELQRARIICLQSNVTDCFRVREKGVEGTIVQMPDECGGPSWARAVSLELSADQTIPDDIRKQSPTSAVYDFKFDYNIGLVRRDAGRLSIRMDYSNVPGYWYAVVDTPGTKKKRDLKSLVDRFYDSGKSDEWYAKFNGLSFYDNKGLNISQKLDNLIYHNGQTCSYQDVPADDGKIGESISIAIQGSANVVLHYGFSMIATWEPNQEVKIHQAAGFVRPVGKTDVTFKMGGSGIIDTAKSLKGSTITKTFGQKGMAGHNIYKGWAFFTAYKETGVTLRSTNGKSGAVPFSGYMEARVKADWGRYNVHFPDGATVTPHVGAGEGGRDEDEVSKSDKNKLIPVEKTPSGFVEVGSTVRLGLQVGMAFSKPWQFAVGGELPDMSVSQYEYARWTIENNDDDACLSTSLGSTMQSELSKGKYAGWNMDTPTKVYVQEYSASGSKECFNKDGSKKTKRAMFFAPQKDFIESDGTDTTDLVARQELPDEPINWGEIPLPGANLLDKGWNSLNPILNCDGCGSCTLETSLKTPCCGCTCLPCKYGFYPDYRPGSEFEKPGIFEIGPWKRDISALDAIDFDNVTTNMELEDLEERSLDPRADDTRPGTSTKDIRFCGNVQATFGYPAYPNYLRFPDSKVRFDIHTYSAPVMKWYRNSSSSCTSWAIGKLDAGDIYDQTTNKWRRNFYQSKFNT